MESAIFDFVQRIDIVTRRLDLLRGALLHLWKRRKWSIVSGRELALAHASNLLSEVVRKRPAVLVHLLLELCPPIIHDVHFLHILWSMRFDDSFVPNDP